MPQFSRRLRHPFRGSWPVLAVTLLALPGAAPAPGPRVVAAWPAGPFEVRVALDRPVGAEVARSNVGRSVAFDPGSAAPGGEQTHGSLRVAAVRLDEGGRTVVLTTDPHPRAADYAVALDLGGDRPVEVRYNLTGVEAAWDDGSENAPPSWTGWWPWVSPATALASFKGTKAGETVAGLLGRKGRFVLNSLVTLPEGEVTVRVTASVPLEASLGGEEPMPEGGADAATPAGQVAVFQTEATGEPSLLTLTLTTGGPTDKPPSVRVVVRHGGKEVDLTPSQTLVPWAPPTPPAPGPLENVPALDGGDPVNGRAVFSSPEAKCANCHRVRGEGGTVGPDLSNLVGHDRREVYRDIAEPSARINPDYLSYTIALNDGRALVGTVRAEGADALRLSDTDARTTRILRSEVEEFRPSATSVMPVGLAGAIGPARLRDLIAFLTTRPREAPAPQRGPARGSP